MRRRGWLMVVVALTTVSAFGMSPQSASAGETHATVPWQTLIRSARARLLAGAGTQLPAATPRLAAAPVPKIVGHDPSGDVPFAAGDITALGYGHNANGFAFSVKVRNPTDPKTDPAWQQGLAIAAWAVDANNDKQPEYIALMIGDGQGHMLAGLLGVDGGGSQCDGTPVFTPGVGYKVVFSPTCGSRIHKFWLQAALGYDPNVNDEEPPVDYAPDVNFVGPLTLTEARSGYWLLGADGRAHAFGLAHKFNGKVFGAVAIVGKKSGGGYWVVDRAGGAHPFGDAINHGGSPLLQPGERITGSAGTPSGNGYWLFSNVGRVFAFGDAHSYGDMSGTMLKGQIIAGAATPSGHGYYMLGSDGGVFTFGDAHFHGSLGAKHLNGPVVDIATTSDGNGYWIFAADGGVFTFHAPFRGSMGGQEINSPVTTGTAVGNGYLLGAGDGGVFNFSTQPFAGSLAGKGAGQIIDSASFTK